MVQSITRRSVAADLAALEAAARREGALTWLRLPAKSMT